MIGSIPSGIITMAMLRVLDLSWNLLAGEIPVEISELAGLQEIFLDNNLLYGSLPALAPLRRLGEKYG